MASVVGWTEKEKAAAKKSFTTELGALTKMIAMGKYKGSRNVQYALKRIDAKIAAAAHLGITASKGIARNDLFITEDGLMSTLPSLVEFTSDPEIRRGIYRRLNDALRECGVEEEYLGLVAEPEDRKR